MKLPQSMVFMWFILILLVDAFSIPDLYQSAQRLFIKDERHLAWGYVDCPPFTPFVAHIAEYGKVVKNSPKTFPVGCGSSSAKTSIW